jgi:predicted AAA+ superfamily ATPase
LIEGRFQLYREHFPVVAVLGARQVGKSTLVNQMLGSDIRRAVFDPVQDVGNAREDPDFFLQNYPPPLFLDEIQYAPELLPAIKRRVDTMEGYGHYVLSGSQNLAILRTISESLAGRVGILNLLPMAQCEVSEELERPFLRDWVLERDVSHYLDLQKPSRPVYPAIWRGGHPRLLDFDDSMVFSYFESYMQTYIERDIRLAADIGSLQTFGAFIRLLAAHTASEINHNQLGRELGIDRKTAVRWYEITEATYQWLTVPAYTRNPTKRILSKGKGYLMDTGFACYLQRITSYEGIAGHPVQGQLFETFVVTEIKKTFQAWDFAPNLYHYRTYAGAEVDLILELNGTLFPIEIKSKSHPSRRDVRGFASFRECFPHQRIGKGLLICAIENPAYIADDVLAVPWWFL